MFIYSSFVVVSEEQVTSEFNKGKVLGKYVFYLLFLLSFYWNAHTQNGILLLFHYSVSSVWNVIFYNEENNFFFFSLFRCGFASTFASSWILSKATCGFESRRNSRYLIKSSFHFPLCDKSTWYSTNFSHSFRRK